MRKFAKVYKRSGEIRLKFSVSVKVENYSRCIDGRSTVTVTNSYSLFPSHPRTQRRPARFHSVTYLRYGSPSCDGAHVMHLECQS